MRRLSPVVVAVALGLAAVAPVKAQEGVNPLEVLIDAFNTAKGQEFAAQFLKDPVPGSSQASDPPMDWEHSTSSPPGYTPDHIDILDTWAIDFRPMPMDGFFTPTDQNQFWAPTGMNDVPTTNFGTMHTFVGDVPHDGSQYADGAYLFGFSLAGTPPVEVAGRCEFVVWINDLGREFSFVNHPSFPGDPAGGTNVAFGLGINPAGQGITSTFALELTEAGSFLNNPDIDIRSFITPEYVGITVPMSQITNLAQINYYTFCVESGFSFAPEDTGAAQTGLIDLINADLGIISLEEAPPPKGARCQRAQGQDRERPEPSQLADEAFPPPPEALDRRAQRRAHAPSPPSEKNSRTRGWVLSRSAAGVPSIARPSAITTTWSASRSVDSMWCDVTIMVGP